MLRSHASARTSLKQWCAVLLLFVISGSELCLPDAIPEGERQNVLDSVGREIPIKFIVFDWNAAEVLSSIAKILVEEALGYHAVFDEHRPFTVMEVVLKLSGCLDSTCNDMQISDSHVALDCWLGSAGTDTDTFMQQHPGKAPEDLGSIGYEGEEALVVAGKLVDEAYEHSGFALDFYRSYNQSHYSARKHFDGIADLPREDFLRCDDPVAIFVDTPYMNDYARWSGDTDGLLAVEGGYHAYCPDGYFWIAPACRHNTSECIPIVGERWGWMVDAYMAWSTAYGIPTAIGLTRTTPLWPKNFANFRVLAYWYRPDASLLAYDPRPINFPRHSPSEWAQGNKRTAGIGTYIGTLVNRQLSTQAKKVHGLLSNLKLELVDIERLLLQADVDGQSSSQALRNVACQWVLANREKWQSWVPRDTSCIPGFGLRDSEGLFTSLRESAALCAVCPPGMFSTPLLDDLGQTYTCQQCDAGTHQNQAGETFCMNCAAGKFSETPGRSECEGCTFGTFSNSSGATSCQSCGNGSAWTTSRYAEVRGEARWIEVDGADNESFCHCRPNFYLDTSAGQCMECTEGANCEGDSQLQLRPGYFSTATYPGSIFRCYGNPERCPGGLPGTCAAGRDLSSVACAQCLPGLHSTGSECVPCSEGDYMLIFLLAVMTLTISGLLHLFLVRLDSDHRGQHGDLLVAGLYATQLISSLQLLVVLRKVDIVWGYPFDMVLEAFSFLSLEHILFSLNAVTCVTPPTPALQFLLQTIGLPGYVMMGPVLVHLALVLLHTRSKRPHFNVLAQTLGSLSVLFFIVLCTSVVTPFECQSHPNGLFTMQSRIGALCYTNSHFQLCALGASLALLPAGFLALCAWLILVEYPKRLQRTDVRFVRMCSFLARRFRPGAEAFAVFVLCRNALFALAPVLPSVNAGLLLILVLLGCSILALAFFKPWRSRLASYTDILVSCVFVAILFQGSFFVKAVDGAAAMILCCLMLVLVIVCLAGIGALSLLQYFCGRGTNYGFFICHQKKFTGSLARLLKIELQVRGFRVFLDADDLTDLTQLLPIVAEKVEMLLVLGTTQLLTRKWCLAEIVTARLNQVHTILVALPDFSPPADHFMETFESATEVGELAAYGFGLSDITDALRWLQEVKTFSLQKPLTFAALEEVADQLAGVNRPTVLHPRDSDCRILVKQDDVEALATAHTLRHLMSPHCLHLFGVLPVVLTQADTAVTTPRASGQWQPIMLVMVCTQNCLTSPDIMRWILEAYYAASRCRILPVLADEDYCMPTSSRAFNTLVEDLRCENASKYVQVLRAIFMQIAVHFLPRSSSEKALKANAQQVTVRLRAENAAYLSSLMDMSWFTSQRSQSLAELVEQQQNIASKSAESLESLEPLEVEREQECVKQERRGTTVPEYLLEAMQEELTEVAIS